MYKKHMSMNVQILKVTTKRFISSIPFIMKFNLKESYCLIIHITKTMKSFTKSFYSKEIIN